MMVIVEPRKGFFMFAKWLSRSLLLITLIGLFSYFCENAYSREVSIFSVNKNLQMDSKDPVYHDYYISGGSEQGFRTGMQVTVIRRVPVHDLSRNRALGDLRLPIAKLKLIFVQKGMAVGRLLTLTTAKNSPIVDYDGVMIGDAISLGNGLDAGGVMEVNEEGEGPKGEKGAGDEGKNETPASDGATSDVKTESVAPAVETSSSPQDSEPAPLTPEEITKNLMPKETATEVKKKVKIRLQLLTKKIQSQRKLSLGPKPKLILVKNRSYRS
jgi:hypothetical protein